MRSDSGAAVIPVAIVLAAQLAAAPASPIIEQVGDTAFYDIESPSFDKLTLDQKLVAYHLAREAIVRFAKLFFANRGNHNEITNQKFLPELGFDAFRDAALAAQKSGAPLPDAKTLAALLESLRPALFDAAFEPSITMKNPPPA